MSSISANPFIIPTEMYKQQRQRLSASMRHLSNFAKSCALLKSCKEIPRGHYSDCNYLFRQDSYFQYLFNYESPDCLGVLLSDGTGIIFIPVLPEKFAVWMGVLPTPESVKQKSGVEEVYFISDIVSVLRKKGVENIHVLHGINSDSDLPVATGSFEGIENFAVERDWLFETLSNQRVIKTEDEIKLLTYANRISSEAHIAVMQMCKAGMSQHQLESTFLHYIYYHGGMRQASYTCICATGHHNATLHYPNNDAPILDGSMALLDMGGEYHCYGSDITCSFPVNKKFTEDQKMIYNAVLDAQMQVIKTMKPGVSWLEMHKLALSVLAKHLIKNEFFTKEATIEVIMQKKLMYYFQPHGLGHLIGMEIHDVGGYPKGGVPRSDDIDSRGLRTCRVLEQGMYLSVEPGIYFNQGLLNSVFADPELSKYFNQSKIRKFWDFGGVRIEDDVLVTADGSMNLTCCPRTVEEIESTLAMKPFSKLPQRYVN